MTSGLWAFEPEKLRPVGGRESDPELAADGTMTYVNDGMPPFLIEHGAKDMLVPGQQSMEFARVIDERVGEGRAELVVLENAAHDDPVFYSRENMARVFAFIDKHLS